MFCHTVLLDYLLSQIWLSGLSVFVINIRSFGKDICLFSATSFPLVGNDLFVHEITLIEATELHLNAAC